MENRKFDCSCHHTLTATRKDKVFIPCPFCGKMYRTQIVKNALEVRPIQINVRSLQQQSEIYC